MLGPSRISALISCLLIFPTVEAVRAAEPTRSNIIVPQLESPTLAVSSSADWVKAAHVNLSADFTYRRPADEKTDVYVATDQRSIFVLARAEQREAITDHALTNGSGVLNDDYIGVFLAPEGSQGFLYAFYVNSRGAQYQTSTENVAFAPRWAANARRRDGGYDVVLQIPFEVMKTSGSKQWSAQFVRNTVATGSVSAWTYDQRQLTLFDPVYAGTIAFAQRSSKNQKRPGARVQVYGLAESAPQGLGGATSRMGADFSLPVTATSSIFATAHPDYSNVEFDQQAITPTAFPRKFAEVRPFFTQGANFFDQTVGCIGNCPAILYTPAIPTFRDGYAYEGTAGHLTFGAFDAIGYNRADDAESINYNLSSPERTLGLSVQRVGVKLPDGSRDTVLSVATGIYNARLHLLAYANAASEYGSFISDRHLASYLQAGTGYVDPTTTAIVAIDAVGAQFAPVDGFVPLSDSLGIETLLNKSWSFSPKHAVRSVNVSYNFVHSRDGSGEVNEHSNVLQVGVDTKAQLSFLAGANFTSLRTVDGELLPFGDLSLQVAYRSNTSAPTFVQYGGGRYYHGSIRLPSFSTTMPIGRTFHLTGFVTGTDYLPSNGHEPRATQWLERVSLEAQISHALSVDAGIRRIVGRDVPESFFVPAFTYRNATNISGAMHYLSGRNEVFFVYGDPNALITRPTLILKWIRYFGAQKGA